MKKKAVFKRLLPLYVGKFFLNFVLWYSIEKLFMKSLGFDSLTVSLMAIVCSITSVFMEIPSGIIADRWSRKGSMILAGALLGASSFMAGISQSALLYAIAVGIHGIYEAFSSGTGAAMIYDTLLEEQGNARNYRRALGKYEMVGGIALITGAFAGGVVGEYSLATTFILTVIPAVISMFCHFIYRDAKIYQELTDERLIDHIKGTFKSVFGSRQLMWMMTVMMLIFVTHKLNREFYQLWYVTLLLPALLFGVAGSVIEGLGGIGGFLVKFLDSRRMNLAAIVLLVAMSIITSVSHNLWIIILAQAVLALISGALIFSVTAQIQHRLPSKYRAGSGSVINAVGRIIFVPCALVFGILSNESIFLASWILVILSILAIFAQLNIESEPSGAL